MSTTALLLMALVTPSTSTYIDYDELGRVRATRGNDGQNVRYTYDDNGNIATIKDAINPEAKLEYDALDRLVKSTDAKSGVTEFKYDAGDRLIWVKDPRGLITTYTYDGFGQLWSQSSPDTGTTEFHYNAAGQRTTLYRPDGSGLEYDYDTLGRLEGVTTPSGSETRSYVYDLCAGGKGRLCSASTSVPGNTLTKVAFGYTPEGQLAFSHTIGSGANDITGYVYDGMGRIKTIEYPSTVEVHYGYAYGRLTTMSTTLGANTVDVATNLKYQPFGPVKSWTYGNGLNRVYNYDSDGRLFGISTANGSNLQQSLTYAYNANDLIEALTNGTDAANSHAYLYDELSRLTKDTVGGGAQIVDDGFDAVGNRTSRGLTTYTIDPASNHMLVQNGTTPRNFVYTLQGNLLSSTGWQGNRSYAYDGFERLKSVTVDGVTSSYIVNALDQRIGKNVGGFNKRFVYTGQNQLLAQTTPTGWKSYLWLGGELVGVVQPTNVLSYVHTDHLGRPEVATNAAATAVWKAVNTSYSRSVTLDNIGGIVVGFPGQIWDEDTDTWYNGFRDYDPYTGRYIQSDPIGLAGGLNTYAYVGGNPIMYIDPYGLHCLTPEEIGAIAGGVEGGIAGAQGGPWAAAAGLVLGGGVGWFTADRGEMPGLVASGMTGAVTAVGEGKSGIIRGGVSAIAGTAGAGAMGPLGAALGPISGQLASPSSAKWAKAFANVKKASAFGVAGAAAGAGLKKYLESTRDADCDCK